MTTKLTAGRIVELKQMAKSLSYDELKVLTALTLLDTSQEITMDFLSSEPKEALDYAPVYKGAALWDQAEIILDDLFDEREMRQIVAEYDLGRFFDIAIEAKVTVVSISKA